jgi:hypothetical protein
MIKTRKMKWDGHVACNGANTSTYVILVENPEWKRILGRSGLRWDDHIKTGLEEIGW